MFASWFTSRIFQRKPLLKVRYATICRYRIQEVLMVKAAVIGVYKISVQILAVPWVPNEFGHLSYQQGIQWFLASVSLTSWYCEHVIFQLSYVGWINCHPSGYLQVFVMHPASRLLLFQICHLSCSCHHFLACLRGKRCIYCQRSATIYSCISQLSSLTVIG